MARISDREIMVALVGTTAIPQPYPQVGTIVPAKEAPTADKKWVEVTSIRQPYQVERYYVQVDQIKALYLAEEAPQRLERGQFRLADLFKEIGSSATGILFVADNAPVIYQTETAVPAADLPGCYRPVHRTCCD